MSKIIAVASPKGGVGKSTISCHLAKTMAQNEEKTVLIETDSGMRGLDVFLDVSNVVYDVYDALSGKCEIENALQQVKSNLALLPAPFSFKTKLNSNDIEKIYYKLKNSYENLVIDLSSGYYMANEILNIADLILVITTPDVLCVRDCAIFVNFLKNEAKKELNLKLLVNRIKKLNVKKDFFKNLDSIIDETGLQLIGAIPENYDLEAATLGGRNLKRNSAIHKIFNAIFKRINNKEVELLI